MKHVSSISTYKSSGFPDISAHIFKEFCLLNPEVMLYIIYLTIVLPNICLDQEEIELVLQYTYLGITIDQDLNMYSHVDLMYRMA